MIPRSVEELAESSKTAMDFLELWNDESFFLLDDSQDAHVLFPTKTLSEKLPCFVVALLEIEQEKRAILPLQSEEQ